MIKKIYLDMDGVLTDFEGRFAKKFGCEVTSDEDGFGVGLIPA